MVDIVTHAAIGVVLGTPFMLTMPELALGLMFGSVAPDLDALSRLFGKRAFLAAHQTWSHSLPVIGLVGLATMLFSLSIDWSWWSLATGVVVGMALHSALDLTNTFGISLWLPFARGRRCLEWLFFIDLGVIALTTMALIWIIAAGFPYAPVGWLPTTSWAIALTLWVLWRAMLHRRAARLAPSGTVALIPSAWLPWRFYGTVREADAIRQITLDGRTGRSDDHARFTIHDAEVADILARVPEVQIMRALSPAYHALAIERTAAGVRIRCRDLRIRNFTGSFGACDIEAGAGTLQVDFHA